MDTRLANMHQMDPGPRPKVKAVRQEGFPVKVCESLEEMRVRVDGLRKPGDRRSAERILFDLDDTNARNWKGHRNGSANEV